MRSLVTMMLVLACGSALHAQPLDSPSGRERDAPRPLQAGPVRYGGMTRVEYLRMMFRNPRFGTRSLGIGLTSDGPRLKPTTHQGGTAKTCGF